jgi:acyl carrier protein
MTTQEPIMSDSDVVRQQVRDYLCENFLFGEPILFGDQDSFLQMGIIDSTGVLELVSFLQEKFGFAIADEEILPEHLDSIHNLVGFIEKKRAASGSAPVEAWLAPSG